MTYLPPNIEPEDEISVTWENSEDGVKVVAVLGEASITVETSHEAAETVPWLVAALPNILEAAWDAIENTESPQEGT